MPRLAQQLGTWTLALGLAAASGSSPGLAWAKPEGARELQARAPSHERNANLRAPAARKVAAAATHSGASRAPASARTDGARLRSQPKEPKKRRDSGPCYAPAVLVVRAREELEPRKLALTLCDGAPNPGALDSLSVLGRPRDAEAPPPAELRAYQKLPTDRGPKSKRRSPGFISAHVMRLHPGLLTRLQKVTDHFPGRTIEIVSGYRPDARLTSRHHHGRALDFRVTGVSNERLRDFLRGFEQTGVGYYPNSSFVHMDVRDDKGYWVDRSGPGERADYGTWPPREQELQRAHDDLLEGALAELAPLGAPSLASAPRSSTPPAPKQAYTPPKPIIDPRPAPKQAYTPPKPIIDPAPRAARYKEPREPTDASQIARIRKDALKALQALR